MPLHQKMKAINPPVIYFGGFAVCATEVFGSAAAHARHADEIVRVGSLCACLSNVLLHAVIRKHEINHSRRIFTAEAADHSCSVCPGEHTGSVLCRLPCKGGPRPVSEQHWAQDRVSG